jgi:hypothetical protein
MKCHAKTASGNACKMGALKGQKYCFAHSPANAAARQAARKLGGYRSATPHAGDPKTIPADIASLADAGKLLNYVLAELLVMDNGIARARALLSAYEMYLKSIEIGELEKRIAALENLKQ